MRYNKIGLYKKMKKKHIKHIVYILLNGRYYGCICVIIFRYNKYKL